MKKIGILTFHRATNYGAILQAYGLLSYLNNQGYEAKIIDYAPSGMGRLFMPIKATSIKAIIKSILLNVYNLRSLRRRYKKLKVFTKYINGVLPLTKKVSGVNNVPKFDAYIVGSDQIWNVCFTGGIDPLYWGVFNRKEGKMISYAGSAAENMDNSFYSNDNYKLLETFDSISVREYELQKYLEDKLPNKSISKVLDPTLLAGPECFKQLTKGQRIISNKYILIYQVIRSRNDSVYEYAKKIAHKFGCEVIEINRSKINIIGSNTNSYNRIVDPSMFVNLFQHAEYIITTSFHGTAFSLLFNKPFSVISINDAINSRAKDLLDSVGLSSRLITLPAEIEASSINWQDVNSNLDELRKKSEYFLAEALK